jgi:predicted ABC-type ATPase
VKFTGSVSSGDPQGLYVLAGPNGAGKSSVAGGVVEASGGEYFNPDDATRRLLAADPSLSESQANAEAWEEMVRFLRLAISRRGSFVFETTLGGETISGLLADAASVGIDVRIWYIALATADLHVERVRQRVAEGGHDIPEDKIRARYDSSRVHLIELIPALKELWVFDNTAVTDLSELAPQPRLLLHMVDAEIVESCELKDVPEWAKSIMFTGLEVHAGQRRR